MTSVNAELYHREFDHDEPRECPCCGRVMSKRHFAAALATDGPTSKS